MPDVLEQPVAQPSPKRSWFTAANAAEMARRSHAPTSARFRAKPEPEPSPQPAIAQPQDDRLELLQEQIILTRAALNRRDLEPKDRAQLIRGLCGLLDQQRIARGEPLPGSRRPRPEPKPVIARSQEVPPRPAETPTPQPVVGEPTTH